MRNVVYHVASTIDGFIAHADHTVDGFLGEGPHADEYLAALRSDYDAVIMGRRTYEFGLQFGVTDPYPWLKQYVISQSMTEKPDPNVELVSENATDFVRKLKQQDGKPIYLCGGGELAGKLLAAGLVDELLIKLNPVVFGSGVPMFSQEVDWKALKLLDTKIYENGVLLLRYQISK